jgi:hypothetical protein
MAEQDAFCQLVGYGGAIHGYKRLLPPVAALVNQVGDHLLADTAFTLQDNRHGGWRHQPNQFQYRPDGRAVAHDLDRGGPIVWRIVMGQMVVFAGGFDGGEQFPVVEPKNGV